MDAMTANCARLKQNLAHLQGELNAYVNKSEKKDETPQATIEEVETVEVNKSKTKQKKGKNKKSKQNNVTNENTPAVTTDTKSIEAKNVSVKTEDLCTETAIAETIVETKPTESDIKCENNLPSECVGNDATKPVDLNNVESQNAAKEQILEETPIISDNKVIGDVKIEEVKETDNVISPILENKDVNEISST